ncbi:hypothetical protein M153_6280001989 [Pseudoloma neurophilia]|uniref:Uncharacterized protein n=1 Tax=Pseudoloma neurophilia TaxID=146866 RepID=A0A0R0M0P2_9MICR|nr:hypothetical protein M153_6280001989 [Pseudoloma neurophilia]
MTKETIRDRTARYEQSIAQNFNSGNKQKNVKKLPRSIFSAFEEMAQDENIEKFVLTEFKKVSSESKSRGDLTSTEKESETEKEQTEEQLVNTDLSAEDLIKEKNNNLTSEDLIKEKNNNLSAVDSIKEKNNNEVVKSQEDKLLQTVEGQSVHKTEENTTQNQQIEEQSCAEIQSQEMQIDTSLDFSTLQNRLTEKMTKEYFTDSRFKKQNPFLLDQVDKFDSEKDGQQK